MAQGGKKAGGRKAPQDPKAKAAKGGKVIAYSDPDPIEIPPPPKTGYSVDAVQPRKPGKKK